MSELLTFFAVVVFEDCTVLSLIIALLVTTIEPVEEYLGEAIKLQ